MYICMHLCIYVLCICTIYILCIHVCVCMLCAHIYVYYILAVHVCICACMYGYHMHTVHACMHGCMYSYMCTTCLQFMYYVCMYVYINAVHACSAHRDQERASYPVNWSDMDGSAVWLLASGMDP